ncbi:16S rRNA (guanine(527)-N(7))-methyltransferase RsmG [Paracoccus sp. SSK6]|uniref:16S rRNA (guanine(527)-N(7))-methyltransferase RsmG n=1 Tax=Paracoccus sp. SSK6 TaxID=3143131 RepID=UPI003219EB85
MIVSRETADRLSIYAELVRRWNSHINLVSSSTIADLETRHLADCLQVADLAPAKEGVWVDLGSGGGLPGIVLAIAKADTSISFVLVESDQRKAAFLRTVMRETNLTNVVVKAQRIEALDPLNAAFISARALAPLGQLMAYLHLHLAPKGTAFLMKGRQWQSEIEEANTQWRFDWTAHPSRTQEGAAILEISGVTHGAA